MAVYYMYMDGSSMATSKTVRDLQAEANVTSGQVALFCGVSKQSISNWRNGIKGPRGFRFDRLRIILNCTAGELEVALAATRRDGGKPHDKG